MPTILRSVRTTLSISTTHARRLACLAFVLLSSVLLTGCFFRSLLGYADPETGSTRLSGSIQVAACDFESEIEQFYGCTYVIFDDEGFLLDITSTFELITDFGLFGVVIDPFILEIPGDVQAVFGSYSTAGTNEPLAITVTDSFPVQPGQVMTAEPGTKFAIVELPDTVLEAIGSAGQDFDFQLNLIRFAPGPVFVKPMMTARVDHQGVRYYPPVFPCVADFAAIPSIQVPFGFTFQDLRPALAPLVDQAQNLACDHVAYTFGSSGGNQEPDCSTVVASERAFWPPNHSLREVALVGGTDPDGDPLTLTVAGVTQDEPVDGSGDAATGPDAAFVVGWSPERVQLRSERAGDGDGRVYRIAFEGDDGQGGRCSGVALVGVPHSRGAIAVDSGGAFNSFDLP